MRAVGEIPRRVRTALFIVVAIVLAATGCSLGLDSQMSDSGGHGRNDSASNGGASGQARLPDTLWSEYLLVQKAEACTLSSYDYTVDHMDTNQNLTIKIEQTLKYADLLEESDGTQFTLKSTEESSAYTQYEDGSFERTLGPLTQKQDYKYVLADDGTLRAEPQTLDMLGVEASFDKFIVYPTIDALRNGESTTTSIYGELKYTDPEAQAELKRQLKSGDDVLKMRLTYTVGGVPPEEIVTSAGTFTDVVGVSVDTENVEILNMNAEEGSEMEGMGELLTETTPTEVVWFARDVGKVAAESRGGLAGEMAESTTSDEDASSDEGQTIPPLRLEGCGGNEGGVFEHVELDEPTAEQVAKLKDATTPQAERAVEYLVAADNAEKLESSSTLGWGYKSEDVSTEDQYDRTSPFVAVYTKKVEPQQSSLRDPLMLIVEIKDGVSGEEVNQHMVFTLDPDEVSLPQSLENLPALFDEPEKLKFLDLSTAVESNWVNVGLDYVAPRNVGIPTPTGVGKLVTYDPQEDEEYIPADSRDVEDAISTAQEYNKLMLDGQ